ncbi:MAG TPA: hypothetical protein VM638_04505 [Actinomycetota bacterium]|nr:hypothetical protein [Actinomycetota bacterium]
MERTERKVWRGGMVAALLAVAVIGTACGTGGAQERSTDSQPSASAHGAPSTGSGIDTPGAELQQTLTSLLTSHVFLAGIAVEQAALTKDPESAQFKAAAEALDKNSQDLAGAIESVYGPEAGDQFLDLWRAHIGMFVDYTVGGLTGDDKMQDKAKSELDQYRQDFGAFVDSATGGNLPAEDVAAALQEHVDSLVVTIDQVIEGKGNAFMSLYEAAQGHMPATASALAGGIIAANPDKFAA